MIKLMKKHMKIDWRNFMQANMLLKIGQFKNKVNINIMYNKCLINKIFIYKVNVKFKNFQ